MSYPKNLEEIANGRSSVAFYQHIADPRTDDQPSLIRLQQHRRPPPDELKQRLDQRQVAVAERRSLLQEEKVQKLSVRLARVALIADRHQRQTTDSWKDAEKRYNRDMEEHMRRRTDQISLRLRNLANHNQTVKQKRDLVMRERYFQKLDQMYESRNNRSLSKVFRSTTGKPYLN